MLAPSIVDIVGPRIHTRPVAGLPLIHVETPRFSKGQRFAKRTTELVVASFGLILLSPVSPRSCSDSDVDEGPVFFRQTRVGLDGQEFPSIKFRSMVVNAEELLSTLD